MSKEKALRSGELVIQTKSAEIVIPSQIPLIGTEISQRRFKKIVSFCQERENSYSPHDYSQAHKKVADAIKEKAETIYQSFFLAPRGPDVSIYAFSEVKLRQGVRVDCVILGPFGGILIEVKRAGTSSYSQLERYKKAWQRVFPKVPSLTLRAGYRANKVTLLKRSAHFA